MIGKRRDFRECWREGRRTGGGAVIGGDAVCVCVCVFMFVGGMVK